MQVHLCNTNSLLFHCFMNASAVVLPDGTELVYAAYTSIRQDQRAGFQLPLSILLQVVTHIMTEQ